MSQHFNKQKSVAKKRNNKKKSSKKQSYRNDQSTQYDNHQINYNSADENLSFASEAEIISYDHNHHSIHYDNHQINYNPADENVPCAPEAEIIPFELIGIQFSEYSLYRKPQFSLKYVTPLGEQPTLLEDINKTSRYTSSFIFRDFSLFI
jgi:hypothetical protein